MQDLNEKGLQYTHDVHQKKLLLRVCLQDPNCAHLNCITRNSSGDEIANVNFLYDDTVHALQNTIDWCINSVTD